MLEDRPALGTSPSAYTLRPAAPRRPVVLPAAWIADITPILDGESTLEQQPGLEFWFTPPGSPSLAQPRRWKMMVVTLLALYPTSLLIGVLVGPSLAHLPLALRAFLQALLVVPAMTYLIMPLATRAFRVWLKTG